MGMAASQVRFLSLQNRKNTIGLNLMTLSNRKMALSRDMNRVSTEYNNAMNQRKFKWSSDSGVTYQNLNYDLLMKPNDINYRLPYIVTDAQGRVVLDDKKIEFDGFKSDSSYRDIAALISQYSGIDKNGKAQYNETGNVTKSVGSTDKYDSGLKAEYAYEIPTTFDSYGFQNSLRYDLMIKLGLIEETNKAQVDTIVGKLYGNNEAYETNNYANLLKSFDTNRSEAAKSIGNTDYTKIFGELRTSAGSSLSLEGGCAMGNLALAKAYQQEYQAYLNIEISRNILESTTTTIATVDSGSTTSMLDDTKRKTLDNGFDYNEYTNTGVSNRMLNLLEQKGVVEKNGTDYTLETEGILANMEIDYDTTIGKTLYDATYSGDLIYMVGSNGKTLRSNSTGIKNWAELYDYDYKTPSNNSYIKDGYILGDDYINNTGNNKTTGCYVILAADKEYSDKDKRNITGDSIKSAIDTILNNFANDFKSTPNINADSVNKAKDMTYNMYMNNNKWNKDGSGYNYDKQARQAAKNASGIFGVGVSENYCKDDDPISGKKNVLGDPVVLNLTNMINAFITFYSMIEAAGGDESKITSSNGTSTVFKGEIQSAYDGAYDASIANMLKNNGSLEDVLDNWKFNAGVGMNISDDSEGKASGTTTITYSYSETEKDESGRDKRVVSTAEVTGDWNASTKTWNSITSIKTSYDGKVQREYSNRTDSTDGSHKMTVVQYDNGTKVATVEYKAESGGDTSAKISLENTVKDASGNDTSVKTIEVKNNEIYELRDSSGTKKTDTYKMLDAVYYLATESGGSTEDRSSECKIYAGNVGKSKFAATIKSKPADLYGAQIDQLVADCEAEVNKLLADLEDAYAQFETRGMDYLDALFKMISERGWVYDEKVNDGNRQEESNAYFNAMLENNMYFITEVDTLDGTDFSYATKLATNVSKLFQVYDTDAQNVALSKYEAEKADINTKEKQLDMRMNKLEAEQDAIKTELDSIKKVIDDNVSNTFKIFS